MPKKYDQDLRKHAVRLVLDKRSIEGCSQRVAIDAVGASLGIAPATIRNWMPRAGEQPAAVAGAAKPRESLEEENRRLRRELAETRRANEILKKASAFFAAELDRPTTR